MKLLFFVSLFMIIYIYLGYPFLIAIYAKIKPKMINKGPCNPRVTILIAAFNEEAHIGTTIKNKLSLEYPKDKLEIIVISDDSTDGTDEIVKRFEAEGVRLIRQSPRAGKTSALNLAVPQAIGEILVFSDANSMYDKEALGNLVKSFNDPEIGYVTGKMFYTNSNGTAVGDGCTAYMKYENYLREKETRVGSIVGVDGGVDAVRRSLYKPMNPDQLPDFILPLKVIEQGYRVVYEPSAQLKEPALKSVEDEYRMRVRVSLRALWALWDMRRLLTFSPSGVFSWQLWSHKALRYLCFIFLIGTYLGNLLLLSEGTFYRLFFIGQNAAYSGAMISRTLEKRGYRIFYLLNYFVLLNWASMNAFFKFILGKKQVTWEPRKG